jgi:pimeloyl-ACP methyl ester carboxylesterase
MKTPKILRSLKIPTLVLLAENDEFADRSAFEIATWFKKQLKPRDQVVIVPRVGHRFTGAEIEAAKEIIQVCIKKD